MLYKKIKTVANICLIYFNFDIFNIRNVGPKKVVAVHSMILTALFIKLSKNNN
jgi:hypothetical protein